MPAPLDLDQLRTFVAIAETGSFTRAADVVYKTQSAVSMQMRRLEERIGKPIFARDGRASQADGGRRAPARLRPPHGPPFRRDARRLRRDRAAGLRPPRHAGRLRRSFPAGDSRPLRPLQSARRGLGHLRAVADAHGDVAHRRYRPRHRHRLRRGARPRSSARSRCSGSARSAHGIEQEEVLPLALSKPPCIWRTAALDGLASVGRKYRVLYTSGNSTAISAAVLAGLAVTVLRRIRRSGRACGSSSEAEGFPRLPICEIGIIRSWNRPASPIVDKLAEHIVSSLDNLSVPPCRRPDRAVRPNATDSHVQRFVRNRVGG